MRLKWWVSHSGVALPKVKKLDPLLECGNKKVYQSCFYQPCKWKFMPSIETHAPCYLSKQGQQATLLAHPILWNGWSLLHHVRCRTHLQDRVFKTTCTEWLSVWYQKHHETESNHPSIPWFSSKLNQWTISLGHFWMDPCWFLGQHTEPAFPMPRYQQEAQLCVIHELVTCHLVRVWTSKDSTWMYRLYMIANILW